MREYDMNEHTVNRMIAEEVAKESLTEGQLELMGIVIGDIEKIEEYFSVNDTTRSIFLFALGVYASRIAEKNG